jgi:hypothetical protein
MALAANCSIKGADVVCKKCGRSLPDTCGDKHPRVAVIEPDVGPEVELVSEDTHWDGVVKDAQEKATTVTAKKVAK